MNDKRFAAGLVALVAAASVAAAAAMVTVELESARQRRSDAAGVPAADSERLNESSSDGRRGASSRALPDPTVVLAGRPTPSAH